MEAKPLKGSYLLVLFYGGGQIITRSRRFNLEGGYYVYVGSAMGSLLGRLRRHERADKNKFWHIDYLLEASDLILAVLLPSEERMEVVVAGNLRGEPIPGFGASDSPLSSHLFRYRTLEEALSDIFRTLFYLGHLHQGK